MYAPHYAMSGGTLIALAANQIVMDPNAVLGPVDPQIGQVLTVLDRFPQGLPDHSRGSHDPGRLSREGSVFDLRVVL